MVVMLEEGCFYGETRARAQTARLRVVLKRHYLAERTPLHGHARPYMALVVRGAFRQHGRAREHLCTPGSLAINTTGAEHCDRFEADLSEVINIELPSGWLVSLAEEGADDPGYQWTTRRGLHERARLLRRHVETPDCLSSLVIEGAAAELLALATHAMARDVRGTRVPAWVRRVEEELRARFRDPPTLTELAALAERSPSQVVRAFKRWHGVSLGAFARRLRAEHARRALLESPLPLHEIALLAGFADQSHMTRELRLHLGITPGRLRRSRRD